MRVRAHARAASPSTIAIYSPEPPAWHNNGKDMKDMSAKKPATSIERYEAKLENIGKPKVRLPRMGCIWIFGLVLFFAISLATGYYHSAGEVPAKFDIPEGRITVSDPEGILLEEDQTAIEALVKDIARQGDCDVAVIFFDAHFANLLTVFDEIAADWAPEKGVLMICDTRNGSMRFGLIGSGWRLADWDMDAVRKECAAYQLHQRGAQAVALLTRLKHSIETAAMIPETEAPGNWVSASAAETVQPVKKNSSAMTEEEIEAEISAQEKAEEARIAAEDKAAEDALDEDYDEEDEESIGMRAYAEKNRGKRPSGILYSSTVSRGDEGSARNYALVFLALTWLVAIIALKIGKKTRESDIRNNPKVLESFKKKRAKNASLRLSDANEYVPDGWLHKGFLKVAALILGILFGIGFVSSTLTDPVEKDVERQISSMIPDYPQEGRIVDQAEAFDAEGRAKVAAAIDHLEKKTQGEMMVYTVATINGRAIEEFSLDAATKWQIGKKGKDNGALLVLVINDHLNRLEIGYGWEGPVNDARAGDLLRLVIPELRAGQYADAAVKVVQGIESFVTGAAVSDIAGTPVQSAVPKVHVPSVKDYGTLAYAKPDHDPRVLDPADSMWGLIGVFGCLVAILAAYWGRIVMTSAPHLVIYDPTAVHVYSSSGGSGGSGSSSSSHSYSSSSSSSHSSYSGGGGSFGGGGASGRW